MEPNVWNNNIAQHWKAQAVEVVARIERAVQSDHDSLEPVLGRLLHPESSVRTHMAARRAVASIVELVASLPSSAPPVDDLLEDIYQDLSVPLTQRCLLRAVILDAFSHVRRVSLPAGSAWHEMEDAPFVQTDIFALPAFGDPTSALSLLSDRSSLARFCNLIEKTGFVGEHSVALLSVPLSVGSLQRVDVMRAIMSMVATAESIDSPGTSSPTPERAINVLSAHVPQQRGPFLVAGIRVRRSAAGRVLRDIAADPLATAMDPVDRTVRMVHWRSVASLAIIQAGLRATNLVLRPPASPVRAQSQARALGMVHEMFGRLAGRPFLRMDFEHVRHRDLPSSPTMMALSAFGPDGQRLATTRAVSLFDVGLGEDFQDVLQEECQPSSCHPASMTRQELMEDYETRHQKGGEIEIHRLLGPITGGTVTPDGE